jgi:hypothetical protein
MPKADSPRLEFFHNTDLNPNDAYLASVPRLKLVLRHPALLEVFEAYDNVANSMQKTLRLTGLVSLWLSVLGLTGITAKLLVAALGHEMPHALVVGFELSALVAIALAISPKFARTRTHWLTARYVTEQIRQWHFQLLLDGELVSSAYSTPEDFENTRAKRWAQFTAGLPSAEGAMMSLIDGEVAHNAHRSTPYADVTVAEEAFRAYMDLRFQRQLAYFKLSRHGFAVRDEWSESIARWALFSAILLAGAQLLIVLLPTTDAGTRHTASMWIAAGAIVFALISGAIRVYRNAIAVDLQRERYDTKWVRLVALKSEFDTGTSMRAKLKVMTEVESTLADECRQFLRQMHRASYLL